MSISTKLRGNFRRLNEGKSINTTIERSFQYSWRNIHQMGQLSQETSINGHLKDPFLDPRLNLVPHYKKQSSSSTGARYMEVWLC